ncbi:MAG: GGDEF domain-containing protein, partial [Thermoanaerobaculia bacterium]
MNQGSSIDALSGLPTFHGLRSVLTEATTAIFLDIDGFRFVNDRLGHAAGDDVLRGLGAWLKRTADALHGLSFRVAGDEFMLLLPGQTLNDAAAIASRLVTPPLPRVTLSAVVFVAGPELPDQLRETLDTFAEKLYQHELSAGRA